MSDTANHPNFPAFFAASLTELSDTIESLSRDHGTSFVNAGADQVYALGDGDYVIAFDNKKWTGLIEVFTPKGPITIKQSEDGKLSVSSTGLDDKTINKLLKECCEKVRSYYDKRYWKTPSATV